MLPPTPVGSPRVAEQREQKQPPDQGENGEDPYAGSTDENTDNEGPPESPELPVPELPGRKFLLASRSGICVSQFSAVTTPPQPALGLRLLPMTRDLSPHLLLLYSLPLLPSCCLRKQASSHAFPLCSPS